MEKRKRKFAYKVDDVVKVVNPVFVERWGYPLTWRMLKPEFEDHPKLNEALALLGLPRAAKQDDLVWTSQRYLHWKAKNDIVEGLCRAAARDRKFGGNTRSLHTVEHPQYLGRELQVFEKRVVKTGEYYAPSGRGEDYENGGLSHQKSHILLMTVGGWIEATNVEFVKRSE